MMDLIKLRVKVNHSLREILVSPAFARIHSHICADGYIQKTKSKRSEKELLDHPRKNLIRNRFYVRYVNTEQILTEQFIRDVREVFGRKVVEVKGYEYAICGKWIYDILKDNGALRSKEWFIPDIILKSSHPIRIEWLKSFFDDESHVEKAKKRIVLNMVNKPGLIQVQRLLNELGIRSTLNGPYRCRQYYSYHLNIYRDSIVRYYNIVGFNHPKKKMDLSEIVSKMGTLGLS